MEDKGLGGRLAEKIRLSLVLKLNLRTFFRLLGSFLALDILLLLLLCGFSVFRAEWEVDQVMKQLEDETYPFSETVKMPASLTVERASQVTEGIVLPEKVQEYLEWDLKDAGRWALAGGDSGNSLFYRMRQTTYIVDVPGVAKFTYLMTAEAWVVWVFLWVVVIWQLCHLIGALSSHAKGIRRTLRPIAELAETTRTINGENIDQKISLKGTQNELVDLAGAINDMLERIQQSYSSQVRFVSDASHELRTPIAVIQGYANLLDRWGKEDPEMLQESIDAIKDETAAMKDLVEQLLFLARGDNDTMKISMEVFDVSVLIGDVLTQTRLIDSAHGFEARRLEEVYIQGDVQLIKQAIRILVDNAIKYTPPGGNVFLSAYQEEGQAVLVVQDEGIGIDEEDLPHIFERFFRADQARTRKEGGSGLGLSIADWIVKRHNGTFEVMSRSGLGTRILIRFPACVMTEQEDLEEIAG